MCQHKNKKGTLNLSNAKKYVDQTKPEEKKIVTCEFPENYDPSYVISAWIAWWQKEEFFKVTLQDALKQPRDKRFVKVLPPTNLTDSLHLGHALMGAIEDTII